MAKLCQIISLLTGKRSEYQRRLTEIYHRFQKPALFNGQHRRYQPNDELGETYPDEKQVVEQQVGDCLREISTVLSEIVNLMGSQDATNCLAHSDVVVDGKILLTQVPVTHLLYLEKMLTDVRTAFQAIPVLDPSYTWTADKTSGYYISEPSLTHRTKKVPRTHVKYEATEHHPAQTEMYYEDVIVGHWNTIKFSAAIPATDKRQLLERVDKLRDAVKVAREQANTLEAQQVSYGKTIFDYLL